MKFSELLAITDTKQRIVIINPFKEVIQDNTCLYFWECNIHHDKKVFNLEVKNNELHVTLEI